MLRAGMGIAALVAFAALPGLASGQGHARSGEAEAVDTHAAGQPHGDQPRTGTTHEGVSHEGTAHEGATHEGAAHEGAAHEEHPPELPNLITILYDRYPDAAWAQFLHRWENQVFMLFFILLLVGAGAMATRQLEHLPGPFQNAVESVIESLDDFVQSIVGSHGRHLVPFLGTLFLFILTMNYAGLVPFLKSPTANINTTLSMAICVFLYVQWTGIRSFGLFGYVDHLAGSPRDVIGFALMPLMLPLHIVGEMIKPMSLSLRLFGNVTGEDVLLAVFVGLGVGLVAVFMHGSPIGLPLQALLYPLLIIFGTIQALVFTLLSTIYFYMMLPHEEHH
jgi:F-type H+-transporting ATPase subunit a